MEDLIKQLDSTTYRLYLPLFGKATSFKNAELTYKDHLYIDLPARFKELWDTPIQNEKALFEPLKTFIHYLATFVKDGQNKVDINQKDEAFDLVTEMDQGIEYILRYWINKHFPKHKVVGEEFGQDTLTPSDYCWYIDPIDGTSNYAHGKNEYCINIGCIFNGKPFLTFVALPSENIILEANTISPSQDLVFSDALCSEFYSARIKDQTLFEKINTQLKKNEFRTMALGYSLAKMYQGHCDVFYKANVKLWDIMAPAALLYFKQNDYWDIEITTYDGNTFSPFSNQENYLNYINQRHDINQRVGLFTVTKKSDSRSKHIIRECIYD